MSASLCLFGPAFELNGDTYLAGNSFSFNVDFETPADQQRVLAYQWFLDRAILINEIQQQVNSSVNDGPHVIGVRILTAEGWSGIKYLDFYAKIIADSFTIQGPNQVQEGTSATYETYLAFGGNAPVRVTAQTTFQINIGGAFDYNVLNTFRDDVDLNHKYATITAILGGGLSQTLPITILNTSVRHPSILVVDVFDDAPLNAAAIIVNTDVTVAQMPTYKGNNFLPTGAAPAAAYILASDLVNNGSALKWRFQFNILKLITQYPNIQDFVLEIRARSNAAKSIYGAYSLKDQEATMIMNGSAGNRVPTVVGGNNIYYNTFQTFTSGGANGNYSVDYLPMVLRFNFNVPTSTLTLITSGQLYYSNQISEMVVRNNCPSGYAGSSVNYTLPQGAFTSTISQQDANSKAQSYFNSYKQQYANNNGTCSIGSGINYVQLVAGAGSSLWLYGKFKITFMPHAQATHYTLAYKTNAIDWTLYTKSVIDPYNTYLNLEDGIRSNNFDEPHLRVRAYNGATMLSEEIYTELKSGGYVFGPLENQAWLGLEVVRYPSVDEFGDVIDGIFSFRYIGTAMATGYKYVLEDGVTQIVVSNSDTPQTIMQRLANAWGYYYNALNNTIDIFSPTMPPDPVVEKV